MTRRAGWIAVSAAALLLPAGAAVGTPGQVSVHALPAFANGPDVGVSWDPAAFTAESVDRQYRVTVQDLTVPALSSTLVPATSAAATLTLSDGHEYAIKVLAEERECVLPGVCYSTPVNGPASDARTTRVDSTPPVVATQIDGGALFTNDPTVVLEVSARDPAAAGSPASGVSTLEIAQPGAFSCPALIAGPCLVPFAPSVPITLSPGPDGPRTVSVTAFDAATTTTGSTAQAPDGNASAPAEATVLLDRLAPTPRVGIGAPIARPGVPVALGGRRSVDGAGGAADSGLDPAGFAWRFGDGAAGQGAIVRHAYAGVGTYRGTLTVLDRAGNAATTTFTVFVGDSGIVTRGRGRVLAPARLTRLAPRRTTVLRWRGNPRARFYNVQLYRVRVTRGQIVRRKLVSTFPRRARQTVPARLLRPGTYHLVVWSGLRSRPRASYSRRPWIVVVLKVRPRPG